MKAPKLQRKLSLKDPEAKKDYEDKLSALINAALSKAQGKKKVENIEIKSVLGQGGQGSVFLIWLTAVEKVDDRTTK